MNKKLLLTLLLSITLVGAFSTSIFAEGVWQAEGTKWKYIEDGVPVVNDWRFIHYGNDYNYYYFDELGYMCVGLKRIGNDVYFFDIDGKAGSRSIININNRDYKTKNKGIVDGVYADTVIDFDAWNAQFIAENTYSAEEKAEIARAEAEAEAKAAEAAEVAASVEKKGPKSALKPANTNANSGPGAEMGLSKGKGAAAIVIGQ